LNDHGLATWLFLAEQNTQLIARVEANCKRVLALAVVVLVAITSRFDIVSSSV